VGRFITINRAVENEVPQHQSTAVGIQIIPFHIYPVINCNNTQQHTKTKNFLEHRRTFRESGALFQKIGRSEHR
jgi:hypothetical protein